MDQHDGQLCDTTYLDRIYDLEEQLYIATEEKCKLQESIKHLQDQIDEYEYDIESVEALKTINEGLRDAVLRLSDQLEDAKLETEELQKTSEHLKRQLEHSEKSYAELSKQKYELEKQKDRRDAAVMASLYYGAPFGGIAIAVLGLICKHLGLFQSFFHRFFEYSDAIALFACGGILSYAAVRLYLWNKDEKKK